MVLSEAHDVSASSTAALPIFFVIDSGVVLSSAAWLGSAPASTSTRTTSASTAPLAAHSRAAPALERQCAAMLSACSPLAASCTCWLGGVCRRRSQFSRRHVRSNQKNALRLAPRRLLALQDVSPSHRIRYCQRQGQLCSTTNLHQAWWESLGRSTGTSCRSS